MTLGYKNEDNFKLAMFKKNDGSFVSCQFPTDSLADKEERWTVGIYKDKKLWFTNTFFHVFFARKFILNMTLLELILCEESIARISESWKCFIDPDSEK